MGKYNGKNNENLVRTTTLKVVERAKKVKINREKIKELAEKWIGKKIVVPPWPKEMHLKTSDDRVMLDYLIILDALNFCSWSSEEKWHIIYQGKKYHGYFALSLALAKFFEEKPEKANLIYLSKISFKEFLSIFDGIGKLLFLKKRWQMVRAVSLVIAKKYRGDSRRFIMSGRYKLSVLVPKIYHELPFFDDISIYNSKKVYFLKRAQILGADIYGAFDGRGVGYFGDLDYLTTFADQKIPQILNHFGILEYSRKLSEKIRHKKIIKIGSKEEVEIRSAAIWAIEYLKGELKKSGRKLYSFEIDWILWNKIQTEKINNPYHLTKTIYY